MTTQEYDDISCSLQHVHQDIVKQLTPLLPDEDKIIQMADFFKILSNTTRIKILQALSLNELCVCDISSLLNMTDSAISHQLKILKSAKLVRNRRDGKTVYYSLYDNHVQLLLDQTFEHISEH